MCIFSINGDKPYKTLQCSLGYSDIASLTYRSCGIVGNIPMGHDGKYDAYVVTDKSLIPDYYEAEPYYGDHWVWIYDDEQRVVDVNCDYWQIYRAGEYGIILFLKNPKGEIFSKGA